MNNFNQDDTHEKKTFTFIENRIETWHVRLPISLVPLKGECLKNSPNSFPQRNLETWIFLILQYTII